MSSLAPTSVFSRGKIGSLDLRNRVIKSATFEGMVHDGFPTELLVEHHATLARGGVGMTTLAHCAVSPDGRTFENQMVLRDEIVPSLTRLTTEVKSHGAAVSIQLGHCGHFTKNRSIRGFMPRGPSRTFNPYGLAAGLPISRAMTVDEIEHAVNEFANAARLAKDSGFDAIELHLGHGYLLSQFLSPITNRRKDDFGGSLENRLRFPLMVVDRVRTAVGSYFPVLAKINLSDGVENGLQIDEAVEIAKALEAAEVSALVMSGGLVDRSAMYLLRGDRPLQEMIDSETNRAQKTTLGFFGKSLIKKFDFEPMFFLPEARKIRAAVSMPLVLLGGITSLAHMNNAMAEAFDFVAVGRPLIHDPYLVAKYMAGELTESGCRPCNKCVAEMNRAGGVRCALQPLQLQRRARSVADKRHRIPS